MMLNSETINTDKHWLDLFPLNVEDAMRPLVEAISNENVRVFNAKLDGTKAQFEVVVRGSKAFRDLRWRLADVADWSWHDAWMVSSLPKEPLYVANSETASVLRCLAALTATPEQRRQLASAVSIQPRFSRWAVTSFRSFGNWVELPDEWLAFHVSITCGADETPPTESILADIAKRYSAYALKH